MDVLKEAGMSKGSQNKLDCEFLYGDTVQDVPELDAFIKLACLDWNAIKRRHSRCMDLFIEFASDEKKVSEFFDFGKMVIIPDLKKPPIYSDMLEYVKEFYDMLKYINGNRPFQVDWDNITIKIDEREINLDTFRNYIKYSIFLLNILAFCNRMTGGDQ